MKCQASRLGPRRFAPSHSAASPLAAALSSPRPEGHPRTIPFVVSRPDHLTRLGNIAESLGFTFCGLETLDDLGEYLRQFPAAAVWTNSQLADGDWRDVLAFCQQFYPSLPVFVTAVSDSPALWAEAAEAGVAELIAAPFAAPEVRRCLLLCRAEAPSDEPVQATH